MFAFVCTFFLSFVTWAVHIHRKTYRNNNKTVVFRILFIDIIIYVYDDGIKDENSGIIQTKPINVL